MSILVKLKKEEGIALPTVIILMAVVILLSASALSVTLNQASMNRHYAASVDALHFAESGINQYLWHLNKIDSESLTLGVDQEFGEGYFRLELIDGSVEDGFVTVRSSGYHKDSPDRTRTLEVMLSKKSFTQYVWLTDSEGVAWNATIHTWEGPFHTNGNLRVWGRPTFNGPVSYSGVIQTNSSSPYGTANPYYNMGNPVKVEKIVFPATNSEIKARAQNGGHYYNGMTAIYLNGDSYDVRTYNSNTGNWMYNGKTYAELGLSFGSAADPKPAVASLPLPDNGVIYIDGANAAQWRRGTGDLYISGTLDGKLTIAAANNIYLTGYDPTDWRVPSYTGGNPRYLPRGAATAGITYAPGTESTSILGLIANSNIEILGKYWPGHRSTNANGLQYWNTPNDVAPNNLDLDGAYMALSGTITYDYGIGVQKGNVNMFGAMIQKTRGAFATTGAGYGRVFEHDPKLVFQTPPYFLEPVDSGWEINTWRETNTAEVNNN